MKKTLSIIITSALLATFANAAPPQKTQKDYDFLDAYTQLSFKQPKALRMAFEDMKKIGRVKEKGFLEAVQKLEDNKDNWLKLLKSQDEATLKEFNKTIKIIDKTMLDNPLVRGHKMIFVRREMLDEFKGPTLNKTTFTKDANGKVKKHWGPLVRKMDARKEMISTLGFPSLNSHVHTKIHGAPGSEWKDTIEIANSLRNSNSKTLYKPALPVLITDLETDWDAKKVLFSSMNEKNRWGIYEVEIDNPKVTPVTPQDDLTDNRFDACYLLNGNIIFTSDATQQGLPCESGSYLTAQMYLLDRQRDNSIRQLTFEQDSDWCPTVMNNGKVMYLRWEYSDIPHYFTRILMNMNPDGTGQVEYYGSNSYFPTAYFFARAIPGHPTKVVGIVGGHHGNPRSGRLVIIDPLLGRREAEGVVQEIPYRGVEVKPIIKDRLIDGIIPQFIHPFPLNENYFIVSAKMSKEGLWGLYLVDTFNNMTLIKQEENVAFFDPILLKSRGEKPSVIAERVNLEKDTANVFISDIYDGEGLKGIPRGAVKKLRLFTYSFAHLKSGGHHSVGIESSWDIKRVLGTVDVETDGSASFTIPANTPIAIQPLDKDGRALQLMRSWIVGMPGEIVSCSGCHESQNSVVSTRPTIALRKPAQNIKEWLGKPRPFSFRYEVQEVLDRNCVRCHSGANANRPNFTKAEKVIYRGHNVWGGENGYNNLQKYVYRPGPENDYHILPAMEFHASGSELVQLLQRGHYNVDLTDEEWDRLNTWIDLNVPYRGKWNPPVLRGVNQQDLRMRYAKLYGGIKFDSEDEFEKLVKEKEGKVIEPKIFKKTPFKPAPKLNAKNFPMSEEQAKQLQARLGKTSISVDLGDGKTIEFAHIPAGEFISGGNVGYDDEKIKKIVKIEKPFWIGTTEITNEIYNLFDKEHDSRYQDMLGKDQEYPGFIANNPKQPVIRISQESALKFCEWLSKKIGKKVTLPTESQWEWAARAGSNTDFWFGDVKADYSDKDNFADISAKKMILKFNGKILRNNPNLLKAGNIYLPRDENFDDKQFVTSDVAFYKPNAWGLYDIHGNVQEWTSSNYKKGTNPIADKHHDENMVIAKGGSFKDRPKRSGASTMRYYQPYQKCHNVGFRVVIEQ